ncbi:MAG: TonB-dependent receptor, partial [Catalinimonas sp.]
MIIRLTSLFALCLLCGPGYAAPRRPNSSSARTVRVVVPAGSGRLTGVIRDDATDEPLPYATVVVKQAGTETLVDGTVTEDDGRFEIKGLAGGTYDVAISFIGYEPTVRRGVEVPVRGALDLGTVKLAALAQTLDEVTVETERLLIEEKVDRTVYNAELDATTRGGDATDVLRRVPLLSVDLDGNVSLRGNQNLRVLINNRPSVLTANNVADALRQIPADQIKSVEVITSPSARYDAEGTSGIINIVLKKNTLEGLTLGVNTGVGLRGSNLGLNGGFRRGKVGLSLGGFGRAGYNIPGAFENLQTTRDPLDGTAFTTTQQADTRRRYVFGRYTLGMDLDINEKNFVGASVQYGLRNNRDFQDELLTRTLLNGALQSESLRDVTTADNSGTVDVNFNYIRSFETPRRELSLLALYSRNERSNDFVNNLLTSDGEGVTSRLKNLNESDNEEVAFQLDFETPLT